MSGKYKTTIILHLKGFMKDPVYYHNVESYDLDKSDSEYLTLKFKTNRHDRVLYINRKELVSLVIRDEIKK